MAVSLTSLGGRGVLVCICVRRSKRTGHAGRDGSMQPTRRNVSRMHVAQSQCPQWVINMSRRVGQISWLAPHIMAQDAACSLGGAAGSRGGGEPGARVQDAPRTRSARLCIVGGRCAAGWGLRREAAHQRAMAERGGESGERGVVSLAHLRLLLYRDPEATPRLAALHIAAR